MGVRRCSRRGGGGAAAPSLGERSEEVAQEPQEPRGEMVRPAIPAAPGERAAACRLAIAVEQCGLWRAVGGE